VDAEIASSFDSHARQFSEEVDSERLRNVVTLSPVKPDRFINVQVLGGENDDQRIITLFFFSPVCALQTPDRVFLTLWLYRFGCSRTAICLLVFRARLALSGEQAGMDGSRTHHGSQRDPTPILKTGRPTGT